MTDPKFPRNIVPFRATAPGADTHGAGEPSPVACHPAHRWYVAVLDPATKRAPENRIAEFAAREAPDACVTHAFTSAYRNRLEDLLEKRMTIEQDVVMVEIPPNAARPSPRFQEIPNEAYLRMYAWSVGAPTYAPLTAWYGTIGEVIAGYHNDLVDGSNEPLPVFLEAAISATFATEPELLHRALIATRETPFSPVTLNPFVFVAGIELELPSATYLLRSTISESAILGVSPELGEYLVPRRSPPGRPRGP